MRAWYSMFAAETTFRCQLGKVNRASGFLKLIGTLQHLRNSEQVYRLITLVQFGNCTEDLLMGCRIKYSGLRMSMIILAASISSMAATKDCLLHFRRLGRNSPPSRDYHN